MRRIRRNLVSMLILIGVAANSPAAETPPDVARVLKALEAAEARLKSYRLTARLEQQTQRAAPQTGPIQFPDDESRELTVVHSGSNRRIFAQVTNRFGADSRSHEQRIVVNDACVGIWDLSTHFAHRYDHAAPSEMAVPVATQVNAYDIDLAVYAYGYGRGRLSSLIQQAPGEWRVTAASNILLLRRQVPGSPHPRSEFELDPARGFLVLASRGYNDAGVETTNSRMEPAFDNVSGLWLPKIVTTRTTRPAALTNTRFTLHRCELNSIPDPHEFDIKQLEIEREERNGLMWQTVSGEVKSFLVFDGKLVPARQYFVLEDERNKSRERSPGITAPRDTPKRP